MQLIKGDTNYDALNAFQSIINYANFVQAQRPGDNRVPTPIIQNDSVDDNTLPMILPGEAQIIEPLQIETG